MDAEQLDTKIQIAKDGEAVHSLGAWIGNRINDPTLGNGTQQNCQKTGDMGLIAPHPLREKINHPGSSRGTYPVSNKSTRYANTHRGCNNENHMRLYMGQGHTPENSNIIPP